MTATSDLAFINAEQRCFEFFKPIMIDIEEGIAGYIGELPISVGQAGYVVSELQMWCFAITGQADTMTTGIGQTAHCHKALASFRAMVSNRKTALLIIGRLRKFLPAGVHANVQRLDIMEGMTLGRDTVELSNDLERGGLHRVWLVEQPMWIQFSNDDENINYEG